MMWDIYGNADRVCVWLGEANDSSRTALRFIKKEVLQLRDFDELCERGDASKKWRSLLELMQREWFSRRWVVQEIALARTAVIYCGEDHISWKDFAIAVELFVEVETATHRLSEVMQKKSKDRHVPGLFDHVSALGASLLVDATDRLFRDYKQEHLALPDDKNEEEPSDADATSDSESDASSTAVNEGCVSSPSSRRRTNPVFATKSQMQPLLSLEYLVSSLTIFDTSNPHDTIYALLAIAKDTTPTAAELYGAASSDYVRDGLELFTQRKRYHVDYKLPYVDVCKDFIQFCIQRSLQADPSRALDVICRPWATEEKLLESRRRSAKRVEEARKKARVKKERREHRRQARRNQKPGSSFRSVEQAQAIKARTTEQAGAHHGDFETTHQDMPLPSWVPQLSGAPFGMYQLAGVTGPKMSRRNADPLVGLPSSTYKSYSAAETKRVDRKALRFRKRFELGHYSMYVRGFHLDTIGRVEQVARNGQIPKEWAELAEWPDADGRPPEAFWRTLVADRGRDGKNPPQYYSRACAESFKKGGYGSGAVNTTDLINYERNSVVSQFCRRVQAVTWNRALVKTKNGRLGLVGKDIKEGDKVCILYGLSVPVILRESQKKGDEMYGKELVSELKFIVRTVVSCYRQYVARKTQHRRRKNIEMTRLMGKWLEETERSRQTRVKKVEDKKGRTETELMEHFMKKLRESFSDGKAVKEVEDKKGWKNELMEHFMKKVRESFSGWRTVKRKIEWRAMEESRTAIEEKAEAEKEAITGTSEQPMVQVPVQEYSNTSAQDQRPVHVERAAVNDSSNATQGAATKLLQNGTDIHSGPKEQLHYDWWEFNAQLKFGRRWKKIIRARKAKLMQEWKHPKLAALEAARQAPSETGRCDMTNQALSGSPTVVPDHASTSALEQRTVSAVSEASERSRQVQSNDDGNVEETGNQTGSSLRGSDTQGSSRREPTLGDSSHVSFPNSHEASDAETQSENEHRQSSSGVASTNGDRDKLDTTGGAQEPGPSTITATDETPGKALKSTTASEQKICPRCKLPMRDTTGSEADGCIKGILDGLRQRQGQEGFLYYQLLGECYVHGMMDGEAMLYQNEESIASVVFEIR